MRILNSSSCYFTRKGLKPGLLIKSAKRYIYTAYYHSTLFILPPCLLITIIYYLLLIELYHYIYNSIYISFYISIYASFYIPFSNSTINSLINSSVVNPSETPSKLIKILCLKEGYAENFISLNDTLYLPSSMAFIRAADTID